MCGSVRGRGQVTRILESLRNRGQFGPVADTQRVGEASGQTDARALDKRFDFAEPGRARMIAELGGCLQTQHLCTELVLSASDSGACQRRRDRFGEGALARGKPRPW